jgi:hypothetical protein
VKIIDTKKYSLTPGLSIAELKQEASMMKELNHVSDNYCKVAVDISDVCMSVFVCVAVHRPHYGHLRIGDKVIYCYGAHTRW